MTNLAVKDANIINLLPEELKQEFALAQVYASSDLLPKHFRNKPSDVFIVLQRAKKLGLDGYDALCEITPINGIPYYSSKLVLTLANRSSAFSNRISFRYSGERWEDLQVTASATLRGTGERVSAQASIKMAIAENWTKNPKYKSMPKQMLSYRAARFLVTLHAPEVLVGINFFEDDHETIDAEVKPIAQLNQAIAESIETTSKEDN